MRIYLKLSKNKRAIPFNYQELLTATMHKWLGRDNAIHGTSANYSFSWLQNTKASKEGIFLKEGAYFFISSIDEEFIKRLVRSIMDDPIVFNGLQVFDIQIKRTPEFKSTENFLMASPVLLKERHGDKIRQVTLLDDDFEEVLTNNFKRKLEKIGIGSEGLVISLNPETNFRQTKLVTYKGIKNKTSFAPIRIKGNPEQIAHAWEVGLGNSTGIGFGALK